MPLDGEEGATPIKPWNKSNLSSATTSVDGSAVKRCWDGDCSLSLNVTTESDYELYLTDAVKGLERMNLTDVLEYCDCDDPMTSTDTSLVEKSGQSGDSGLSSLELDQEAIVTPARDLSCISPEFKYKISIYSKVSGCRMTNLTDYWIVKQIRVAILQRLTDGDPMKALQYKFGYEKMANGGLQIISDSEELIETLGKLTYFAGIPCKMTFPDTPRVVGFIKGLPTDLEPSDLKDEIRKSYPAVYSVRYVTEKSRGLAHGMQRPCAFISFNLRYLPKSVAIFDEMFELQVPNPMQCTRCCRYGHQGKQCRAQTRCSFCGGTHQRQYCTAKTPSCINCLGVHTATSHDCAIWQQGKLMNELRYRGGMTAEEAISKASSGKVAQKKHSFTHADFFENQDTLYFGESAPTALAQAEDEGISLEASEINQTVSPVIEKTTPVHERAAKIFPFLDLMTDFFLKVKNPESDYTSAVLMPGYDDFGFPIKKTRRSNIVAKNFKESVRAVARSPGSSRSSSSRNSAYVSANSSFY